MLVFIFDVISNFISTPVVCVPPVSIRRFFSPNHETSCLWAPQKALYHIQARINKMMTMVLPITIMRKSSIILWFSFDNQCTSMNNCSISEVKRGLTMGVLPENGSSRCPMRWKSPNFRHCIVSSLSLYPCPRMNHIIYFSSAKPGSLIIPANLPLPFWSQLYSEEKIWRVWLVHQAQKSHRFQGKIFLCHIMQHVICSIIYIRSFLCRCWTLCTACLSTPTRTTTPFKSTPPPM